MDSETTEPSPSDSPTLQAETKIPLKVITPPLSNTDQPVAATEKAQASAGTNVKEQSEESL